MHPFIGRAAAGITIGGAAIWGISGIDNTVRDDSGAIVEAGDLGAFVTQVGDCLNFDEPVQDSLVSVTDGVPCSSPHGWQVIYKGQITLNSFDEPAIEDQAQVICDTNVQNVIQQLSTEKLEEYANAGITWLQPTIESFAEGDRTVDCLVGSDSELYTSSLLD